MDKIRELKAEYESVQIPEELDNTVRQALKNGRRKAGKANARFKELSVAAAVIIVFFASVNISPAFADALSEVPVLGGLVRVLTIRELRIDRDTYDANIVVPAIEGLDNKKLQDSLNERYLEENKKLFEEFKADMEELEAAGGGHMGVDSGYEILTDNDRILSISRYVVNTVGSSSTTLQFDTVDKQKEILITLPSLFIDDSYIDIISTNIKEQMEKQMAEDENKYYWYKDETVESFERIKPEQSFYINSSYKLVISFDKYEVAPGYMGTPEFEIPTGILTDILAGEDYIK